MQTTAKSQQPVYILTLFFSLILSFGMFSSANALAPDPIVRDCKITPFVYPSVPPPEKIGLTNNLRRKTAAALVAEGDLIYVKGRVLDERCVPVPNAEVKVWQANAKGVYQNQEALTLDDDENFVGSGRAITDNLGQFTFITIMPGSYKDYPPHMNVEIRHEDLSDVTLRFIFETKSGLLGGASGDEFLGDDYVEQPYDEYGNELPEWYSRYPHRTPRMKPSIEESFAEQMGQAVTPVMSKMSDEADGMVYYFNVTMRGFNQFLHY